MEPGHLARAANGHLVPRAIEHGVYPDRLRDAKLPGNMAVFTLGDKDSGERLFLITGRASSDSRSL